MRRGRGVFSHAGRDAVADFRHQGQPARRIWPALQQRLAELNLARFKPGSVARIGATQIGSKDDGHTETT